MRNPASFAASLRNFHSWLAQAGVPGAMDIDAFLERRGKFLVLEAKPFDSAAGVVMPLGQYIALSALAEERNFTVVLVAEDGPDVRVVQLLNARRLDGLANGRKAVVFPPDAFPAPVSKTQLGAWVRGWYDRVDREYEAARKAGSAA